MPLLAELREGGPPDDVWVADEIEELTGGGRTVH
jgi:hypothetical protein